MDLEAERYLGQSVSEGRAGWEVQVGTIKDRTIIQLVVLYGCETWSLILRQDYKLGLLRIGC